MNYKKIGVDVAAVGAFTAAVTLPQIETTVEGVASPDGCGFVINAVMDETGNVTFDDEMGMDCGGQIDEFSVYFNETQSYRFTLDQAVEWSADSKPFQDGQNVSVTFNSSPLDHALDAAGWAVVNLIDKTEDEPSLTYAPNFGTKDLTVSPSAIRPTA